MRKTKLGKQRRSEKNNGKPSSTFAGSSNNSNTPKQGTLLSFFTKVATITPTQTLECVPALPESQSKYPRTLKAKVTPASSTSCIKTSNTVICPVCNQQVLRFKINQHLDEDCTSYTTSSSDLQVSGTQEDKPSIRREEDDVIILEEKVTTGSLDLTQSLRTNSNAGVAALTDHSTNEPEIKNAQKVFLSSPCSKSPPSFRRLEQNNSPGTIRSPKTTLGRSKSATDLSATSNGSNSPNTLERQSKTSPKQASRFSPRRYLHSPSKQKPESLRRNLFSSPPKNPAPSSSVVSPSKESIPRKTYEMPYYLENFQNIIDSIHGDPHYAHLFDSNDHQHIGNFVSLTPNAKKLYVRLFQRKFAWHRIEKIEYAEIAPNLEPYLLELVNVEFLRDVSALNELEEAVELLSAPELKQLCKELKLAPALSKELSAQTIVDFCKKHKKNFFSTKSSCDVTLSKAKTIVRCCFKLSESPRRTFLRKLMLHSLPQQSEEDEERGQHQPLLTLLMVNLGRMSYPAYRIIKERHIFPTRERLLQYEEASHLDNQVRDAVESNKWPTVCQLTEGLLEKFLAMLEDEEFTLHDKTLPLFLRKFTPGSAYSYCLTKRVEALQRDKNYLQAVDILTHLLSQKTYLPYYRGHWYERLALNCDQHIKDRNQAYQAILNGLQDDYVSPSHKLALSVRARKWLKSKQYEAWVSQVQTLTLISPTDAPTVVIQGRSLPRDTPGYKMSFIRGDSDTNASSGELTICSVEELVIGHYESLGFREGIHGEGSTLVTLLGLFFWDILYDIPMSDVFLSPHQAAPLDLTSPEFYTNRKFFIDGRSKEIENWSPEEAVEFIRKVWEANNGTVSLVSWDRFKSFEHLQGLVYCMGTSVLAGIFHRLVVNHRQFRSGFPDLIVWNPTEKTYRIIEVKGPNDRLSTKQIVWLDYLISIGAQAEVCYVEAIGAKRITPASRTTRQKKNFKPVVSSPAQPSTENEAMESDFISTPKRRQNKQIPPSSIRITRAKEKNVESSIPSKSSSPNESSCSPKRKKKRTTSKPNA